MKGPVFIIISYSTDIWSLGQVKKPINFLKELYY